ncbi:hypothetical protein B5M09_011534 [Aphanomyces astaci]|uniref:Uncharacterized protein n=1 Tax=Aphanomyces astaci TaxID=112090 RepID=A0A3R7WDM5_APHAT|nr:hypothetical protein B5M09_011534 [Aphanomyces astaci]
MVTAHDANKSCRRERKRKMMVSYRKEKKLEECELKMAYRRLEMEIHALRASTHSAGNASALPWKDIALALEEEVKPSHVEYQSLKEKVKATSRLLRCMEQWTIREPYENTLLHQMISKTGDHVNLVVGIFPSPTRTVLVSRQILHDEAWGIVPKQRNRLAWFEFVTTPLGYIHIRAVLQCSHRITNHGPVDMPVEASMWGCDLSGVPPPLWESRLRRDVLGLMPISLAKVKTILGV